MKPVQHFNRAPLVRLYHLFRIFSMKRCRYIINPMVCCINRANLVAYHYWFNSTNYFLTIKVVMAFK